MNQIIVEGYIFGEIKILWGMLRVVDGGVIRAVPLEFSAW